MHAVSYAPATAQVKRALPLPTRHTFVHTRIWYALMFLVSTKNLLFTKYVQMCWPAI